MFSFFRRKLFNKFCVSNSQFGSSESVLSTSKSNYHLETPPRIDLEAEKETSNLPAAVDESELWLILLKPGVSSASVLQKIPPPCGKITDRRDDPTLGPVIVVGTFDEDTLAMLRACPDVQAVEKDSKIYAV